MGTTDRSMYNTRANKSKEVRSFSNIVEVGQDAYIPVLFEDCFQGREVDFCHNHALDDAWRINKSLDHALETKESKLR